jgi:hypothetical protein
MQDAKTPGELPDPMENNSENILEKLILKTHGQSDSQDTKIQQDEATVPTKRTNYGIKSSAAQFSRLATADNSLYDQDQDDKDNDAPTLIHKDASSEDEDNVKTEDSAPALIPRRVTLDDESSSDTEDSDAIGPDIPTLEYSFNSDDDDDDDDNNKMPALGPTHNNRRLYALTDNKPQENRSNVVFHNYPDNDITSFWHDRPTERGQQFHYGYLRGACNIDLMTSRGDNDGIRGSDTRLIGLMTSQSIRTSQGLLDMGNPRHCNFATSIYNKNDDAPRAMLTANGEDKDSIIKTEDVRTLTHKNALFNDKDSTDMEDSDATDPDILGLNHYSNDNGRQEATNKICSVHTSRFMSDYSGAPPNNNPNADPTSVSTLIVKMMSSFAQRFPTIHGRETPQGSIMMMEKKRTSQGSRMMGNDVAFSIPRITPLYSTRIVHMGSVFISDMSFAMTSHRQCVVHHLQHAVHHLQYTTHHWHTEYYHWHFHW